MGYYAADYNEYLNYDDYEDILNTGHTYYTEEPHVTPGPDPEETIQVIFILQIVCVVIGIISDLLILFIILRNQRMHNKTNVIIANVVSLDALTILTITVLISISRHSGHHLHCAIVLVETCFQYGAYSFIAVLISNWIMANTSISSIIISVYTLVVLAILVTWCLCEFFYMPLAYPFLLIVPSLVLIVVIVKEVICCYKKWWKKDPLSGETRFRLNFGRIYVYNWVMGIVAYLLYAVGAQHVLQYVRLSHFLSGLYLSVYLIRYDRNYKMSFYNLIACRADSKYAINAIVSYADDESDESSQNVIITFNESRDTSIN